MIKALFDILKSENSRITIQVGILGMLICGAFFAGAMHKEFSDNQVYIKTGVDKLIKDNERYRESFWSFQMQKEFTQGLMGLNEGMKVPNISEIKMNNTNESKH